MDIRQLEHFTALIAEHNFARAAERVNLSQPAFSRSIQQLERQLGVCLFERGRQGASPTVFARAALPHIRALLGARDALQQALQGINGLLSGDLGVGVGPYPALGLMDRVAARFIDRHPAIHLRLHTADWASLHQALLAHDIELFVADTRALEQDARLEVTRLPQPDSLIFCRPGHPLSAKARLCWADLLDWPFALTRVPDTIERQLQQLSSAAGGLRQRIECDNVAMLLALVSRSNAISLAPANVLAEPLRSGQLISLALDETAQLHTQYGLVMLRQRQCSPAAEAFRNLLLSEAGALAGPDPATLAGQP